MFAFRHYDRLFLDLMHFAKCLLRFVSCTLPSGMHMTELQVAFSWQMIVSLLALYPSLQFTVTVMPTVVVPLP